MKTEAENNNSYQDEKGVKNNKCIVIIITTREYSDKETEKSSLSIIVIALNVGGVTTIWIVSFKSHVKHRLHVLQTNKARLLFIGN